MSKAKLEELNKVQTVKSEVTQRVWNGAEVVKELAEESREPELLTKAVIKRRTKLLAEEFIKHNKETNPVLLTLLDGGTAFATIFQNALKKLDFKKFTPTNMSVSSYGNETSSGKLEIKSMPKVPLGGRKVYVLDDVCETGKTYLQVRELLKEYGATEVNLIVLVDKVQKRMENYVPEFTVFKVAADAFLVGMGMDYFKELRNESEVRAVVNKSILPNSEERGLMKSEEALNEELRKLIALEKSSKPGSSNLTVFGGNIDGGNIDGGNIDGVSHTDTSSMTPDINPTLTLQ